MAAITPRKPYAPRDAVSIGFSAAGTSAVVGTVVSAVQNTLAKHKYGAIGVITRSGSTIALFTALGGFYSFGSAAASNLREKNDAWNEFYGGVMAGICAGIYRRTLPAVFGYGAGIGLIMGAFSWGGGSLGGIYSQVGDEDKVAWREKFFATEQRRPRSEVLQELRNAPRMHRTAE